MKISKARHVIVGAKNVSFPILHCIFFIAVIIYQGALTYVKKYLLSNDPNVIDHMSGQAP